MILETVVMKAMEDKYTSKCLVKHEFKKCHAVVMGLMSNDLLWGP